MLRLVIWNKITPSHARDVYRGEGPGQRTSMDIRIFKPKVERILRASDLETVSAKRVRKQLMEDVGLDLKPYKTELDELIRNCFQSFLPGPAATVENVEPVIKEEANHLYLPPAVATTITTKRHKVKAEVKEEEVVDEGRNVALPGSAEDADVLYARALQAQYDSPRASRSIGTKSTAKRKRTVKKKSGAATETMFNSDGETVEVKKKKRALTNNGFNKLLTLSDELAELLGVPYLSRPQVSKQIWAYIKAPERNLQDPNDKRYINCDDRLTALLGTPRVHMFSMTKILQKHMRDDGTAPIGFGAGEKVEAEDVKSEDAKPVLSDSDKDDVRGGGSQPVRKYESSSEDED